MRVSKPHGSPERNADLRALYQSVREASARLGAPLSDADATVQSMPDASPAKWHLAHTTWFFETMILGPNLPGYRAFDPRFNFLFNSYYESVGARQPRPRRGMITRPSLETISAYRGHVDRAMGSLMQDDLSPAVSDLIELGCHHEQQHQELMLTDILHLFAQNPLRPAYKDPGPIAVGKTDSSPPAYRRFDGGVVEIGHDGAGFAFDCEGPRHRVLIEPYELADRLVTNAEWMAFMAGRLPDSAHLAFGRMGDGSGGRLDGPALLGRAGGWPLVDDAARSPARRSRRAGHACELFRG
jgi:ergothioneine biosynthesis protein EgtB